MNNYILGIKTQITEFSSFQNILNLFNNIQEMLDNPLSFWSLNTMIETAEYSKRIEGEKNFYTFLSHFKTLKKITKHPLSFYLLGDSESYFSYGGSQSNKSYFRAFAGKHVNKEVAGLLPSDTEGEGFSELSTPYLYDISDINEGMKLLPIPVEEIFSVLGKNYFLDFLTKLKSLIKFFKKVDITDSVLFKGFLQKMLLKITGENIEDVVEKLFPIPIRIKREDVETKLIFAGDLISNYTSEYEIISYSQLTKSDMDEKHQVELFNFKFDYKEMLFFEICKIIYTTKEIEEVYSFIEKEIFSVSQNSSLILNNYFVNSYIDKLNKINIDTDLVEFYIGNPYQASFCYDYCNYMTDISKYVSINLQKTNISNLEKTKEEYSKSHIELVQSVWSEVLEKLSFSIFGDNIERDLFSTSNKIKRSNYLKYNFTSDEKEAVNLNRYFAFPPFIELGIDAQKDIDSLIKEEKDTLIEENQTIEFRNSSLDAFKKARDITFPIEKAKMYYSLDSLDIFGLSKIEVNKYITLKFLKNNLFLKRSFKGYIKNLLETKRYNANFIGGFIEQYSTYNYKKGTGKEIKGAFSSINMILSLLMLTKLYKKNSYIELFIKKIEEEMKKGIIECEKVNPTERDIWFVYRLLLSSKAIWDTLKTFKNLLYVKNKEGYDTLFNYINKKSIKQWGSLNYASVEDLIKKRELLSDKKVEEFITKKDNESSVRQDVLDNLGHLLVEIDYINLIKEVKKGDVEIIINIPGNMLNKIYDDDKIMELTIRNVFDYIYFDFSNASLESVSGIDRLVSFLYSKLGLNKTSILIYNDYKINRNTGFIYRLFDRLLYRNQSDIVKNIISKIGEYDNNLFTTLNNKYRRIF